MADLKIACPHCNGHIAYAQEMGGRSVACPHCHVAIVLPKRTPVIIKVIIAALALTLVYLGSMVAYQLFEGNKPTPPHPPGPPPTAVLPKPLPVAFTPKTADDQEIAKLCKQYYDAESSRDAQAIYSLFSTSSKKSLNPGDVFIDGTTYNSVHVESVEYRDGTSGKSALAKVKRSASTSSGGTQETTRDLQFFKETGGWKVFPVFDLARKIVSEFNTNGFAGQTTNDLQRLRDNDAYTAWDNNNTNAFEAAFKLDEHHDGIFPWSVEFTVESNKVDNLILILNYRIGNKGQRTWPSSLLEFDLKQNGNMVSTENDLLPNVPAGQTVQRSVSFLLTDKLQQTTEYYLDVSYPDGRQSHFPLIQNVPLEFTVHQVSELAKLDVLGTEFDPATGADGQNIMSASIVYQVQNISSAPIQSLDVKCEWYSPGGEQIDQSTDYVVGYGDAPFAAGQSKTGIIRCSKGSQTKVPVKVDIYLESGEKRTIVSKGLLIQ